MGRGRQPTLDGWEGKENQKSKVEKEEQFHERKTRTFSAEETGGLDQPDGSKEGPP
jgi:hypothetical protein